VVSPLLRGLMTLVVFVLTFIVSMLVGFWILLVVLTEVLGYDLFDRDPNPIPDWLSIGSQLLLLVASLALASFSGWRIWRGHPPWWAGGPPRVRRHALLVFGAVVVSLAVAVLA
jgi:hypothetical protein